MFEMWARPYYISQMKRLLHILIASLFTVVPKLSAAQILTDGTDLSKVSAEYIGVAVASKGGMKTFASYVDFGQKMEGVGSGSILKWAVALDGETMLFNTYVHVINYFHEQGWEYAGTNTAGGKEYYLFRRGQPR